MPPPSSAKYRVWSRGLSLRKPRKGLSQQNRGKGRKAVGYSEWVLIAGRRLSPKTSSFPMRRLRPLREPEVTWQ
jgi:hypothetical protein